jgi:hypothetical protein
MRLWKARTPFCGRAGPSKRMGCGSGAGAERAEGDFGVVEELVEDDGVEATLFLECASRINALDSARRVGASKMSKMGWRVTSSTSARAAWERAVVWYIEEEWTSLLDWPLRHAAEDRALARFTVKIDMIDK